jgi:hypothetical protein
MALNAAALDAAIVASLNRRVVCPTDTELYRVADAFGMDPYWRDLVRSERFSRTIEGGILYRPAIVEDIHGEIVSAFASPVKKGVMIKGPQGIGKSHSLVNTVLKLESSGEYLVTFFPDCSAWDSVDFFVEQIVSSMGSTATALGFNFDLMVNEITAKRAIHAVIKEVSNALTARGKQWVFVFDQINKLFTKPQNQNAKHAAGLAFPFSLIEGAMLRGRITCVISASANNEIAYKDHHEGFNEYFHTTNMTREELGITFAIEATAATAEIPGVAVEEKIATVEEITGSVPLFAANLLEDNNVARHDLQVIESVKYSLASLAANTATWQYVKDATVASVLHLRTASLWYDKKFFTLKEGTAYKYEALVPQVITACKEHLWHEIMNFVAREEATLLEVCRSTSTLNSARGQHFEYMVIQRCLRHGVVATIDNVSVSLCAETAHGFSGRALPNMLRDGVYFPFHSKFPAIDLVLKQGDSVFGIQIHVNPHEDVIAMFEGMCKDAGWFETFNTIYLVYLSPEEQVKSLVAKLVDPVDHDVRVTRSSSGAYTFSIRRVAIAKDALQCLQDLLWPAGCSMGSP